MAADGKPLKVMVAGTFDLIHPGHVFLLREAAKIGEVHVVVGTDSIVEKLKGRPPVIPQSQRVFMINSLKNVKNAVLGHESMDFTNIIEEIMPDIILLGPDQFSDTKVLLDRLREKNINVEIRRLPVRANDHPFTSTTSIMKHIKERTC